VCASSAPINSAQAPAVAFIDALRTGTHRGYDRLTIEFTNGQPASNELRPQSGTSFTQGASGPTVTLAGKNGILVVIHGVDLHTSYRGSTDIKTGYATLVEVRQVEDFEGVVQLVTASRTRPATAPSSSPIQLGWSSTSRRADRSKPLVAPRLYRRV
jgi:hypothetical protein